MNQSEPCPRCGEPMIYDGLQWTCVECIRRTIASHAHKGQPVVHIRSNKGTPRGEFVGSRSTYPLPGCE